MEQASGSYRMFSVVWMALLILLGLTIAVAKLNLLGAYSIIGALCIASLKAFLVLNYFMHLRRETRLIKGTLMLALGAVALIIILTFVDTGYR